MVRQYVRKKAVEAVKSIRLSGYEASKGFQIPRTTMMNHVTGRRGQKSNSLGRATALHAEVEEKLANSLHVMEKNGLGLSR
ncbi:unnamed protein product [Parnassius apollo]|uniref:(apollo) hypothetical protein n=1 Tax=Parnassius apollo TaxID=110799 RepID=A0A8S3X4T2_PARAO|nr:unnamed protein product [Parnassius apollo]